MSRQSVSWCVAGYVESKWSCPPQRSMLSRSSEGDSLLDGSDNCELILWRSHYSSSTLMCSDTFGRCCILQNDATLCLFWKGRNRKNSTAHWIWGNIRKSFSGQIPPSSTAAFPGKQGSIFFLPLGKNFPSVTPWTNHQFITVNHMERHATIYTHMHIQLRTI